jgi:arginyl-tRNA synthetase
MIREHLNALVAQAIRDAQSAGELPAFDLPAISVERPRQPEMGDYASTVAMQLARAAKMPPPKIAQLIATRIPAHEKFTVEVAGNFINFRLTPAFLAHEVEEVLKRGEAWGNIDLGKGQKAQVEHGSANPTGYATVGTGRNVVVGDTLANTLEAAGYTVHREWYVNDAGSQIRVFGSSVFARYAQALGVDEPLPERGYQGEDVQEVGQVIAQREGDKYLHMPREEAVRALGRMGIDLVMARIAQTLARLNIRYDNFFSEKSLWTSGLAGEMLEMLSQKGLIVEHDGAIWFSEDGSPIRAGQGKRISDEERRVIHESEADNDESEIDDQKSSKIVQAVVIRSSKVIANEDERPTYFASDIPYAWNKVRLRGFNPAVYVWGEDHQADVPRVMAAAKALGLPEGAVRIIIYRFITFLSAGKEVRMGKRKGNALLIDDIVDETGPDAFRYIMLSRSVDTKFAFDLDLLREQNDKNPVFYVQYGHARICSIERKAEEEGWLANGGEKREGSGETSLHSSLSTLHFDHPSELMLIRKILELPEVVELVARTLQPHHYTTYARDVTQAFSKFYEDCRIKGSPPAVIHARLQLARAAQLTLAKALKLMGMTAPERM